MKSWIKLQKNAFFAVVTSAFSFDKVQVLITFTLVRATSVNAFVKLIRAVEQAHVEALVNIWLIKYK